MKIYVKRDEFKSFEQAKIAIDRSEDWATLRLALGFAMDYWESRIKLREEHPEWEENERYIADAKESWERYKAAAEDLDLKNAIEWNGK